MGNPIFERVAEAALERAMEWLPALCGGRRAGDEWLAERTRNGGPGDSWSFSLRNGRWAHLSGEERGNDAISFVAALHHTDMGPARSWLCQQLGFDPEQAPRAPQLPTRKANGHDPLPAQDPIPEGAPAPDWGRGGAPDVLYRYGNVMWVARYEATQTERKRFVPWTWRGSRWHSKACDDPAPMYNLTELAKDPGAPVLIVEGEKCVDAAQPRLASMAVTTWHGGTNRWREVDWSPVKGRRVFIWPDADAPGRRTASELGVLLVGIAASVRILRVDPTLNNGEDIADLIAAGWDGPKITAYLDANATAAIPERVTKEEAVERVETKAKINGHHTEQPPAGNLIVPQQRSVLVEWASMGLHCNAQGHPHPTLANASAILRMHGRFKGHIWWDSFRGRIYQTFDSEVPMPWTDTHTRRITVDIQQQLQLEKFNYELIQRAVITAAQEDSRNSLQEYLNNLTWDGIERLQHWLADYAGVKRDEHSEAVARNWLIAMVARAYQSGCKMDNMPVLEGISGLSKTRLLEVLGGEWYKSLPMDFGSKDFLQALKGAWLVEIPDMTGFGKVAHSAILATITIRNDTYRAPYAHAPEDHARTCVFAATSETDDYLTQLRGKRRYWPVRCTEIDIPGLIETRDQLFAEAVCAYRGGSQWYQMPAMTSDEQAQRAESDMWERYILDRAEMQWAICKDTTRDMVTSVDLLVHSLVALEPGELNPNVKARCGKVMDANGWISIKIKGKRVWIKPRTDPEQPFPPALPTDQ